MKIDFNLKYGLNKLTIPTVDKKYNAIAERKKTDVFTKKITIFNDIPSDGVNLRRFDRFVIEKCMMYSELSESADETVSKIVNTQNIITKDIEHYKPPIEYAQLAEDERENFYTVRINDFVVFGEVDDVVTTSQEWTALQKKYKDNGFSITSVNASIFGMDIDNIHIMHV